MLSGATEKKKTENKEDQRNGTGDGICGYDERHAQFALPQKNELVLCTKTSANDSAEM